VLWAAATGTQAAAEPIELYSPACFFQETVHQMRAFCPQDITGFTLADDAEHWMVRR
jgi:hypothetical protein